MKAIDKIKENKINAVNGINNALPMPFPNLRQKLAGFQRGLNICISANSGVGKSTLSKFFLIYFIKWSIEKNVDLHIRYYALEESTYIFESTIMLHELYEQFKIRIDLDDLLSNRKALPDDVLEKVESIENNFMVEFRKKCIVVDHIDNPTGIYKDCKEYLKQHGKVEMEGEYEKTYTPNNPNSFFVVFVDHLSELNEEMDNEAKQKLDLAGTMKRWSSYALKHLCKRYNAIIFNVQQQSAAEEGIDNIKLNKLKPSLNGLGDNKRIGRAYRLCIGLFDPKRHDIPIWDGIQIKNGMEDNYRDINIFKNNFGVSNLSIHTYFDGMTINFEEIKNSSIKFEEYYKKVKQLKKTEI